MNKICFKCGIVKPLSSFYAHPAMPDGTVNKCKSCNKLDVSANYRKNIDHYKEYVLIRNKLPYRILAWRQYRRKRRVLHPGKYRARAKLATAIKNGKIVRPKTCAVCMAHCVPHGHHVDYRKPLLVKWLCRKCHYAVHNQILDPL